MQHPETKRRKIQRSTIVTDYKNRLSSELDKKRVNPKKKSSKSHSKNRSESVSSIVTATGSITSSVSSSIQSPYSSGDDTIQSAVESSSCCDTSSQSYSGDDTSSIASSSSSSSITAASSSSQSSSSYRPIISNQTKPKKKKRHKKKSESQSQSQSNSLKLKFKVKLNKKKKLKLKKKKNKSKIKIKKPKPAGAGTAKESKKEAVVEEFQKSKSKSQSDDKINKHSNSNLDDDFKLDPCWSSYPLYKSDEVNAEIQDAISKVDWHMKRIRNNLSHPLFETGVKRLVNEQKHELQLLEQQKQDTLQSIEAKFACLHELNHNDCTDRIKARKLEMLAKYQSQLEHQVRSFQADLRKNLKRQKKKRTDDYNFENLKSNSNSKKQIQKEKARQMYPCFNNKQMQAKWVAVQNMSSEQMENDVNEMLKNQDPNVSITDILKLFPIRKVCITKMQNQNILIVGKQQFKVGHCIIVKFHQQSTMIGTIYSIDLSKIHCKMRDYYSSSQKKRRVCNLSNVTNGFQLISIAIEALEEGDVQIRSASGKMI